ncbi:MAG TPA: hypothetical protein VK794_01210 [Steroidobacteraceae bacterium]|jgi:hypothetical protein|nr:hypothetical protein [Steroidobacteraceae bacterium]
MYKDSTHPSQQFVYGIFASLMLPGRTSQVDPIELRNVAISKAYVGTLFFSALAGIDVVN